MSARLLFALILVAVTLAWAGSASAVSISFIEPASETANILVSTDISATIFASPELASVSAVIPGLPSLNTSVALREGSLSGPISDLLTVISSGGAFVAVFQSDTETPITGTPTLSLIETGDPQLLFSTAFDGSTLTITAQSDLEPVPEPATLILFGTTMTGLGLAARWRRHRQS